MKPSPFRASQRAGRVRAQPKSRARRSGKVAIVEARSVSSRHRAIWTAGASPFRPSDRSSRRRRDRRLVAQARSRRIGRVVMAKAKAKSLANASCKHGAPSLSSERRAANGRCYKKPWERVVRGHGRLHASCLRRRPGPIVARREGSAPPARLPNAWACHTSRSGKGSVRTSVVAQRDASQLLRQRLGAIVPQGLLSS